MVRQIRDIARPDTPVPVHQHREHRLLVEAEIVVGGGVRWLFMEVPANVLCKVRPRQTAPRDQVLVAELSGVQDVVGPEGIQSASAVLLVSRLCVGLPIPLARDLRTVTAELRVRTF